MSIRVHESWASKLGTAKPTLEFPINNRNALKSKSILLFPYLIFYQICPFKVIWRTLLGVGDLTFSTLVPSVSYDVDAELMIDDLLHVQWPAQD